MVLAHSRYPELACLEPQAVVTVQTASRCSNALVKGLSQRLQGMQHLFDGYGMLAKFRFADGRVWVSNRFVESNSWKAFRDSGKMAFSEFGTGVSLGKNMWNMVKHYSGMGQGKTPV